MRMHWGNTALVCGLLGGAVQAHAVLMTVEAMGTTYNSYDADGNFSGARGSFNGRGITATWIFDTDAAPAGVFGGALSSTADHVALSNWITGTVELHGSGSLIDEATMGSVPDFADMDSLHLGDEQVGGEDNYSVSTFNWDVGNSPFAYEYFYSTAFFKDITDDVLQGVSLGQTFEWLDNDVSDYGTGFFQYDRLDPFNCTKSSYTINSIRVYAAVPEPASLGLFVLGLAGLGASRRIARLKK